MVDWFSKNSKKLSLDKDFLTETSYDYLPLPEYPESIFMCKLNQKTYERNHTLSSYPGYNITDISFSIFKVHTEQLEILAEFENLKSVISIDLEGSYSSLRDSDNIKVKVAHQNLSLADYLNEFPLIFYTSNLKMISQEQITQGYKDITPYDKKHIIPIDWESYKTNIRKEFYSKKDKRNTNLLSIHEALELYLKDYSTNYDYIFYDHGTGEMADYITLKKNEKLIEVQLVHVKSASSLTSKNNNAGDIYEVVGQCIKSINWIKNSYVLEKKIKDRNKKNYAEVIKGDLNNLNQYLNDNIPIRGKLVACQPSLTNSKELPQKIGEILSAVETKVKDSLVVNAFEVWGS
ncbi:hypothetical protein JEOAER750_01058 [Jeotgalicoccus aerolatus]|uniref:Phage protein n=1 Tax=Jeotgalicoccus aerolatus TaxID=709510 RepID=A0ABS4HMM1_9STAP|nr:hypothetical protein [Jeotgalicoccus aerolatus]MBP1951884.1 hypothetical protein [Jeotgalicoccus aerolatus]GGD93988.1 hypothetical protein GCM10007273_02920 [Jeotgalicoccus aerolatus]CAD2074916.1 hypothetical protein JEOAER750_01058 [Jeotgalicoccus aerolatus]